MIAMSLEIRDEDLVDSHGLIIRLLVASRTLGRPRPGLSMADEARAHWLANQLLDVLGIRTPADADTSDGAA